MNKSRLIAQLKVEAAEKAYVTVLAAVFISVFLTLDTVFGHSRSLIPVTTAMLVAWGAASMTNTFLSDAYDTRIKRLRNNVPGATTEPGTEATR